MKPSLGMLTILFLMGMLVMVSAHVTEPLTKDDPGFNCYAHGNRICEAPELESVAWQAWDASHESERLDSEHASRVEYVGAALIKPSPNTGYITVSWEDGRWYVFRATYI
jgi:hypothetical protein